MVNLTSVSTRELVDELKHRLGVETTTAKPYQGVEIKVNGPAVILIVTD